MRDGLAGHLQVFRCVFPRSRESQSTARETCELHTTRLCAAVCRPHSSVDPVRLSCLSPRAQTPSGDPRHAQLLRPASPLLTALCAQRAVVWMRGVCSRPLVMGTQAASGFCFPLWNKQRCNRQPCILVFLNMWDCLICGVAESMSIQAYD